MAVISIPTNTKIDFVGIRFYTFGISLLIILVTAFCLAKNGLKYGTDFVGGSVLEIRIAEHGQQNIDSLKAKITSIVGKTVEVQEFGSKNDYLIKIDKQAHGDDVAVLNKVKDLLVDGITCRRAETIGPKVGAELVQNGLIAIGWSLLAMLVYIWIRFEWQFGICAVLALIYDCISIFGLFAVFGLEFNETAIVALLITASYSINDTVVVFDRIRENKGKQKFSKVTELINNSLNETLSRTLLTSLTTLLALVCLFFLGGAVIAEFSLPIIVGITTGTYSSIFIAAPLLLMFKRKSKSPSIGASSAA